VDADGFHNFCQLVVIGEAHAAVAVATQGLCREEGRASDIGQGAGLFALVFRAEGLSGVFDDEEAVFAGDGVDGVIIGGESEEIDRDDAARAKTYPLTPTLSREGRGSNDGAFFRRRKGNIRLGFR
jgi:hypothetical protein